MPRRAETRLGRISRQLIGPLPPSSALVTAAPTAVAEGAAAMMEMTDTEKFMFDLQGYLHVPAFLSPQEVDDLNAAFDANWEQRRVGAEASKRQAYDQFYGCGPYDPRWHRLPDLYELTF